MGLISKMKKTSTIIPILAIAFLCFLLGSCKKSEDYTRPISYLSIYNATESPLNFKIGEEDRYSAALGTGTSSGYIGVYEGTWPLLATLASNPPVQASVQANLIGDEVQSLFVLRSSDSLEFFTIKDDLNIRNPDRPLVKFLNLSPDTDGLTLTMTLLNTPTTFENVKYKQPSAYQELDEKSSYIINLTNSSNGQNVIEETSYAFEKGKIYTIWTTGRLNAATPATEIRMVITEAK
jgi:hypothetical protein